LDRGGSRPQPALVEDPPGGSDEGCALAVFHVAGLLAYQHHRRTGETLAKDGLGGPLPEMAGPTPRSGLDQIGKGRIIG
jgi:hypothetical protein